MQELIIGAIVVVIGIGAKIYVKTRNTNIDAKDKDKLKDQIVDNAGTRETHITVEGEGHSFGDIALESQIDKSKNQKTEKNK